MIMKEIIILNAISAPAWRHDERAEGCWWLVAVLFCAEIQLAVTKNRAMYLAP